MKTTLIDSPVANVANIARALRTAGADLEITSAPIAIANAQKLVLPGVGSFIAAMQWLTANAFERAIHDAVKRGASLLGVCVGHQLLFELSHEMGTTPGLWRVSRAAHKFDGILPVTQIGWNRVAANGPLFDGVENGVFSFVNSYAAMNAPDEIA